jgi:hypothetical protein
MPTRSPLSRGLRGLLYAALALAILDGLWIGTAEWLIRSGRVGRWLALRPERFQASFGSLASPLPGVLIARGVDLRGQTERLRWQVTADRAWGFVDPFALLTRELRFTTLRGEGVAVRGYRIARADDPARRAAMPPIPPFPGPAGPPRPRRVPWSWEFPDLHLRDVREVWLEEARAEGSLSGRGGFVLRRRRDAEIFPSTLDLAEARLSLAGVPGGELTGRVRFAVAAYPYRGAGGAVILPRVDAHAAVRGTFMASRLGRHFLGAVEWIEMAGPPAPFTADLRVEEGRLRPGSSARFEPTEQEVTLFGVALVGGGEITLAATRDADGERCDVGLRFTRFEARHGTSVLMRGEGLHAELATRDMTIDGPPKDLALAFDLGRGELPDLADLGGLLPSGSTLRLSGGHGVVTGSGRASSAPHSATGKLELRLGGVDVTYSAARLRGDLRATVLLKDGDLTSRRFALGGTEIVANASAPRRRPATSKAGGRAPRCRRRRSSSASRRARMARSPSRCATPARSSRSTTRSATCPAGRSARSRSTMRTPKGSSICAPASSPCRRSRPPRRRRRGGQPEAPPRTHRRSTAVDLEGSRGRRGAQGWKADPPPAGRPRLVRETGGAAVERETLTDHTLALALSRSSGRGNPRRRVDLLERSPSPA